MAASGELSVELDIDYEYDENQENKSDVSPNILSNKVLRNGFAEYKGLRNSPKLDNKIRNICGNLHPFGELSDSEKGLDDWNFAESNS